MALALAHLTHGNSATSPATAPSVAFANSTLYIVSVSGTATAGNTMTFTAPTGGGLTFVSVKGTSVSRRAGTIWCAYVAAGAITDTLSIPVTSAGIAKFNYSIDSVTGSAATSGTSGLAAFGVTGATNEATSTNCTVTLASFADAVNNVAFGTFGIFANVSAGVDTGYTSLRTEPLATWSSLTEYILGQDTAVTATFASNVCCGVAAEIKMASASTAHELGLTGVGA